MISSYRNLGMIQFFHQLDIDIVFAEQKLQVMIIIKIDFFYGVGFSVLTFWYISVPSLNISIIDCYRIHEYRRRIL